MVLSARQLISAIENPSSEMKLRQWRVVARRLTIVLHWKEISHCYMSATAVLELEELHGRTRSLVEDWG